MINKMNKNSKNKLLHKMNKMKSLKDKMLASQKIPLIKVSLQINNNSLDKNFKIRFKTKNNLNLMDNNLIKMSFLIKNRRYKIIINKKINKKNKKTSKVMIKKNKNMNKILIMISITILSRMKITKVQLLDLILQTRHQFKLTEKL